MFVNNKVLFRQFFLPDTKRSKKTSEIQKTSFRRRHTYFLVEFNKNIIFTSSYRFFCRSRKLLRNLRPKKLTFC